MRYTIAQLIIKKFLYLKLLNAIINAALVLVDVSPSGPRSAKRGDIASGGLGDSIEANEHFDLTESVISLTRS